MIKINTADRTKYKSILSQYKFVKAHYNATLIHLEAISKHLSYALYENNLIKYNELLLEQKAFLKARDTDFKFINKIDIRFKTLTPNEQQIITLRYFKPRETWDFIGNSLHLSGEYCRIRLHNKALYKLFVAPTLPTQKKPLLKQAPQK